MELAKVFSITSNISKPPLKDATLRQAKSKDLLDLDFMNFRGYELPWIKKQAYVKQSLKIHRLNNAFYRRKMVDKHEITFPFFVWRVHSA